jgi:hypothetical protein
MDGSANLRRETRHEARQFADSGHNLTCSLRGDKGNHPTPADDAKDDVSRTPSQAGSQKRSNCDRTSPGVAALSTAAQRGC